MSQQLGRGLGALLSDRSKPALDTSEKYKSIREKEKKLEELQGRIDEESKVLEDLRKKLTIELMLNGKVDKTELFKMEEKLDEKVKEKEVLVKEIETLKNEVRNYAKVDTPSGSAAPKGAPGPQQPPDEIHHEIDIRLVKELMPHDDEVPEASPHDEEEHIEGLKKELDRTKQVQDIRREVYGDEQPPTPGPEAGAEPVTKKKVRRIVAPRRVRVIRGTAKPVSKIRDDRMYTMMEEALQIMNAGDSKGARAALEVILDEYPNDDEVLYHIGNTYFMENDWEDAEALYRKALEKNPRSYRALNNLGVVLQKQGNQEAAIRSYNQALEIEQNYERAWLNLGKTFMALDPPMLREAMIFLRRALEIQPGLRPAMEMIEECKSRLNPDQ